MHMFYRLKMSRDFLNNTYVPAEPIPWNHVFGTGGGYAFCFPLDPVFRDEDYEVIFRYRVRETQVGNEVVGSFGASRTRARNGCAVNNIVGTATVSTNFSPFISFYFANTD